MFQAFQQFPAQKQNLSEAFRFPNSQSLLLQRQQPLHIRLRAALYMEKASTVIHDHRRCTALPGAVISGKFSGRSRAKADFRILNTQLIGQPFQVQPAGIAPLIQHGQR